MEARFGDVIVTHSARGIPTYLVEAFHDGLHKHTVLRSTDPDILKNKAVVIAERWNEQWDKQSAAELRIQRTFETKEARRLHSEQQKEIAAERTAEAQQLLHSLQTTLTANIELDPTLDWEQLKIKTLFSLPPPAEPALPPEPTPKSAPPAPERSDFKYRVRTSLLDWLIPSRERRKCADAQDQFEADLTEWNKTCAALASEFQLARDVHVITKNKRLQEHAEALTKWEASKDAYYEEQTKQHADIDAFRTRYESKAPDAIIEYCERVLSNSDYPSCVPREFDFDLNPETGLLIINCRLPSPEDLPRLAEVKYVQSTDTLSEKLLSDAQSARLYDDLIYQITLRTLHELFQSDSVKVISAVVFNGIVTSIDRSTGNEATACILSIQASRDAFLNINLAKVDPKACFRQLKGVGSSKLHSLAPVAPLVELRRDDRRFIPSYKVAERLNEGFNLATIDWEDFEHLVREIFSKEFSAGGGEVKVTQASRDGGVDAIAFDPDPIRGGKIVIQAKRYAYTVGVSAVRDLYGTVLNEGASKGILVTTSDYGPDAYEFANGKPLTLLSGSNLLHLLGKHGIPAHINLAEARKLAHERSISVRGA
jgi:restriction system protein